MKQIYLILGLLLVLSSCNRPKDGEAITSEEGWAFEIIKIDECEYLRRAAGNAGYLAHKGNCVNPIHIYNPTNGSVDELMTEIDSMSQIINSY